MHGQNAQKRNERAPSRKTRVFPTWAHTTPTWISCPFPGSILRGGLEEKSWEAAPSSKVSNCRWVFVHSCQVICGCPAPVPACFPVFAAPFFFFLTSQDTPPRPNFALLFPHLLSQRLGAPPLLALWNRQDVAFNRRAYMINLIYFGVVVSMSTSSARVHCQTDVMFDSQTPSFHLTAPLVFSWMLLFQASCSPPFPALSNLDLICFVQSDCQWYIFFEITFCELFGFLNSCHCHPQCLRIVIECA